jgi:hypothetical protein
VGTHRSVSRCAGDVVGSPLFSGVVALLNTVDDYAKGYHVHGLSTRSIQVAYMDWCEKCTCCVYQVFPAGCTLIQIIVTLEYE